MVCVVSCNMYPCPSYRMVCVMSCSVMTQRMTLIPYKNGLEGEENIRRMEAPEERR